MNPEVKKYMAKIGRKGGKVMSEKKLAALKELSKRPRPGARKPKTFKTVKVKTLKEPHSTISKIV